MSEVTKPASEYLPGFRRWAVEVHAALEWAFSALGDVALAVALTIAAVPLWFELSQMAVVRSRVGQALSYVETGSRQEMQLQIALGHAHWYTERASAVMESAFSRALELVERFGETSSQLQVLWGMWAIRRGRGDYRAALAMAERYAEAATAAGDAAAIHLSDRILALTHHYLGNQTLARQLAEHALSQPQHIGPTCGIGFQVETPIAMAVLLARILWVQGFPDQAMRATQQAIDAARPGEHPFSLCYALTLACVPVPMWAGALDEAVRRIDTLVEHGGWESAMKPWISCFAGVLRLRQGDERDALIAAFVEARIDLSSIADLAKMVSQAEKGVPSQSAEDGDALWNSAELLRVDAELLLWHDAPGAAEEAEAKLLRSLEIACQQSALSWELRSAMSLARCWQRSGRGAEAHELVAAVYGKFTEGFGTADLTRARELIAELTSVRAME